MKKKNVPELIAEQAVESMRSSFLKYVNEIVPLINGVLCHPELREYMDKLDVLDKAILCSTVKKFLIVGFSVDLLNEDVKASISTNSKTQRITTKR